MAATINVDAKEIKEGVVRIHKRLELRKLYTKLSGAGKPLEFAKASATRIAYRNKPES